MSQRVLVTGASGHVGGELVRDLVNHGYIVRASVRNLNDAQKTHSLKELGVEIVEADLFDAPSMAKAVAGMDGLFQVAGVYDINPKNSHEAEIIIKTGIEGMENALRAASSAGVKKVVLTSSCVTIAPVAVGSNAATEKNWIDDEAVPYIKEKTSGERHAWKLAKELGLDMVSVLPGGVLGGGFNRSTPSTDIVNAITKGALRMGVPQLSIPFIDVADVATAHRLAFEKGIPGERYIALHSCPQLIDYVHAAIKHDPSIGAPLMIMPKFMTVMVPALNMLMSFIFGFAQTYTRQLHKSWHGREWKIDDSYSRKQLGFVPLHGLEESIKDTMDCLKEI